MGVGQPHFRPNFDDRTASIHTIHEAVLGWKADPLTADLSSENMWRPCIVLCGPSCMHDIPQIVKTIKPVGSFTVKLKTHFIVSY